MVQVVSSDDDDVVQVTRTKIKEGKKKSQVRDPRMSGLENRSRSTTLSQGPSLGPDFAQLRSLVEAKEPDDKDSNDNDYDDWVAPVRIDFTTRGAREPTLSIGFIRIKDNQ